MKKLSPQTKNGLAQVRSYLKCENIVHGYNRKVTKKSDELVFYVDIYDVRNNNVNFDSINPVIMSLFENGGYDLQKCDRISLFYFDEYEAADLRYAFFYDGDKNLIKVADH